MSDAQTTSAARLALLARAMVERSRFAAADAASFEQACKAIVEDVDEKRRAALVDEAAALASLQRTVATPQADGGGAADAAVRQRASVELKLETERAARQDAEKALQSEQADHREATEALALRQKKIKELETERSQLLEQVDELESKLRVAHNATEQAELKYDKLKNSRTPVDNQVTQQAEQLAALQAENERLTKQIEATLKEKDHDVSQATSAVEAAADASAATAFARLWQQLRADVPDVFVDTIVPTEKNFAQLGEAFVEFLRTMATIELHVHQLLRDLRQVSESSDKLNHFYIMFTKNPGLLDTLKAFVTTGKGKGNFTNLLRAHQAWARAFATGAYKTIVRSPNVIADELNYKSWPLKTGFTKSEDAALGEYFKANVQRSLPEKLGTAFRKHIAEMAYEDYNELMKRR